LLGGAGVTVEGSRGGAPVHDAEVEPVRCERAAALGP
jgi:hypothetical protein